MTLLLFWFVMGVAVAAALVPTYRDLFPLAPQDRLESCALGLVTSVTVVLWPLALVLMVMAWIGHALTRGGRS